MAAQREEHQRQHHGVVLAERRAVRAAVRIAEVRKAVETGTYPLVPMKVADAIVAAGMLLRSPQ